MSVITTAFRGDKAIPVITIDTTSHNLVAEHKVQWPSISSERRPSWNMDKLLPSISVENSLSSGEMERLHDLWNGAALSARASRMGRRGQGSRSFKIPDPISIPDPESIPPATPSASLSVKSAIPSSTGTQKRSGWGFLSARPRLETLEVFRTKAQDRLKKKLKYTKSTPNFAEDVPGAATVTTAECAAPASLPSEGSVPNELSPKANRESVSLKELEDVDGNAIYFTLDPSWRNSQDSLQFQFITPLPVEYGPLGRPDSPLLHRHHSLDQLSSVAQTASMLMKPMEHTEMDLGDVEVAHPIDELHSYLEL